MDFSGCPNLIVGTRVRLRLPPMVDRRAGLSRRINFGLDRLSPELPRPSCHASFSAQCAQPLYFGSRSSAHSTQRSKSSAESRVPDTDRHDSTFQGLPRSERGVSLTEFLAVFGVFLAVQAIKGFLHYMKAVCNGFGHYETRGKPAYFARAWHWKDDRGAALAEAGAGAGLGAIEARGPGDRGGVYS